MSLSKPFNTRPLYQQVADEFISRIVSRQWAPGQAIENETEIARSLGISLGTVRKAFDILTEHKLLERHQGKGTVVCDPEAGAMRSRFSNFVDRAGRRIAGEVTIHDVSLDLAEPVVAEQMGINPRTPVIRFGRRRTHLGRCFMHETVSLRVGAASQSMTQAELDMAAASRWIGHDLATHKVEEVGCAPADEADAALFGIAPGASVLTLKRLVMSYQRRPLELRYARCHLGPDLAYLSQ
jgi:GntR family transcriptional regulator